MKYKNEMVLKIDGKDATCGDPFVMRYNGRYYLYPSTEHTQSQINCFVSENLVDWTYAGAVCEEDVLRNAYAPEVIYANERFYLCTSPAGNGHYIYTAEHPLGPFTRITDNIQNMIDGAFFLDNDEQLYFTRANHKGISIMEMSEDAKLKNRVDLNAELYGWTEGPAIIYNNGFYYLTYCGNHLISKGYRVEYGTSKSLLGDYRRGKNNPMLIQTHDEFNSLGHSSTVLAPDLDGYYIVYHRLKALNEERTSFFRTLNLDRLSFNGRQMSSQATYYEIEGPKMPDCYAWLDEGHDGFIESGDFLLSRNSTNQEYTAEFNFKNCNHQLTIIFDYIDSDYYLKLVPDQYQLSLIEVKQGKETILDSCRTKINFQNFHTVRIKAGERIEVYLDNMLKLSLNYTVNGGKIGYKHVLGNHVSFTGFSQYAFNESDKYYPKNIPCIVECTQDLNNHPLVMDDVDEIHSMLLVEGEIARFNIASAKKENYGFDLYCKSETDIVLELTYREEKRLVKLIKSDNPYAYCKRFITTMEIDGASFLEMKVVEGALEYKFLDVYELNIPMEDIHQGFIIKDNEIIARTNTKNILLKQTHQYVKEIQVDFELLDQNASTHSGGILLNVDHYSDFPAQVEHGYCGYYISVNSGLVMVDRASYGLSRVYDRPMNIGVNKRHQLRVVIEDTQLIVYIDGNIFFSCFDEYFYHYGMCGLYVNPIGNVKFSNFEIKSK